MLKGISQQNVDGMFSIYFFYFVKFSIFARGKLSRIPSLITSFRTLYSIEDHLFGNSLFFCLGIIQLISLASSELELLKMSFSRPTGFLMMWMLLFKYLIKLNAYLEKLNKRLKQVFISRSLGRVLKLDHGYRDNVQWMVWGRGSTHGRYVFVVRKKQTFVELLQRWTLSKEWWGQRITSIGHYMQP